MKRLLRENIPFPYSLHDMNIIALEADRNKLTLRTQSGIVKTTSPYSQLDGYVKFHDVRWNSCFVYLLGITGNAGTFTGEKMLLKDFIDRYQQFGFSVMDETYGENLAKYSGFLLSNRQHCECLIEIYHEGDMVYVVDDQDQL